MLILYERGCSISNGRKDVACSPVNLGSTPRRGRRSVAVYTMSPAPGATVYAGGTISAPCMSTSQPANAR
jgi:hypothetical protein